MVNGRKINEISFNLRELTMNKILYMIFIISILSCVINIGDVNQRHGELNKSCKKLLEQSKQQVYSEMLKLDMGKPEKIITTSDSTETVFFYKRYLERDKNRYYDEIILDFRNDILRKFKVDLVR